MAMVILFLKSLDKTLHGRKIYTSEGRLKKIARKSCMFGPVSLNFFEDRASVP